MFMQIHTLTSYAASLLNRDDEGLAKRLPFGNATRTRVSSQCLKRHWRLSMADMIDMPSAIRSTQFFELEVLPRLIDGGIKEAEARDLTGKLLAAVISNKAAEKGSLITKQPVMFGVPERDYFVRLLLGCAKQGADPAKLLEELKKEHRSNWRAMVKAGGVNDLFAGVEGAMFGRFVTSDILARTDAAVHVAHALTTHALDNEVDFFSVVDDLQNGANHIGDMELGAGLFYSYVVVDVPLLISNLSGCDRKEWRNAVETHPGARQVIQALVRAITTVSPGAKLGPTAPYARTDFALLEVGTAQPRSLANAFLRAIRPREDLMQESIDALGSYLAQVDGMYGVEEQRFVASTRDASQIATATQGTLPASTHAALDAMLGAA